MQAEQGRGMCTPLWSGIESPRMVEKGLINLSFFESGNRDP